jgi:hypothetical protein
LAAASARAIEAELWHDHRLGAALDDEARGDDREQQPRTHITSTSAMRARAWPRITATSAGGRAAGRNSRGSPPSSPSMTRTTISGSSVPSMRFTRMRIICGTRAGYGQSSIHFGSLKSFSAPK